jgi:hypothetical protein
MISFLNISVFLASQILHSIERAIDGHTSMGNEVVVGGTQMSLNLPSYGVLGSGDCRSCFCGAGSVLSGYG